MLVPFSPESRPFLFLSSSSRAQMHGFPFPQTWQQQDLHVLFPVCILGLAAESEAGAEPLAEAQGAISPGPGRAGGDLQGGVAEVPLQQPLAQPPAQGGGRPGSGGAAAAQTLVLLGAGGAQKLRWGCGETWEGSGAPLPSLEPWPPSPGCVQLTSHNEAQRHFLGAQWMLSSADI